MELPQPDFSDQFLATENADPAVSRSRAIDQDSIQQPSVIAIPSAPDANSLPALDAIALQQVAGDLNSQAKPVLRLSRCADRAAAT
jgi:hypothetical protein